MEHGSAMSFVRRNTPDKELFFARRNVVECDKYRSMKPDVYSYVVSAAFLEQRRRVQYQSCHLVPSSNFLAHSRFVEDY